MEVAIFDSLNIEELRNEIKWWLESNPKIEIVNTDATFTGQTNLVFVWFRRIE